MDNVCDSTIRNEVLGSDHCPIVFYINVWSKNIFFWYSQPNKVYNVQITSINVFIIMS